MARVKRRLYLGGTVLALCMPVTAADPAPTRQWVAPVAYDRPQTNFDMGVASNGGYASVAFLSNDTLVAWFLTRDRAMLRQRADRSHSSITLHAQFLRVSDGTMLTSQEWPADIDAHLLPTHDGEFVIYSGGVLTRYGSDHNELQRAKIQEGSGDYLPTAVSLDGHKVGIVHQMGKQLRLLIIDADTLHVFSEDPSRGMTAVALGIEGVAAVVTRSQAEANLIAFRDIGGWRPVLKEQPQCTNALAMLSDDLLAAENCGKIDFFHAEGGTIASFALPDPYVRSHSAVSRSGMAVGFAIAESREKGNVVFMAPDFEVRFFRRNSANRIETLRTLRFRRTRVAWNIAISPDGSHAAVLSDRGVELFQLP